MDMDIVKLWIYEQDAYSVALAATNVSRVNRPSPDKTPWDLTTDE